jgi:hypothetical protein
MSTETQSSNKRLYYRLQGEIYCLKKLMATSDEGNFRPVTYKEMQTMLRDATEKFEKTAERSRQLSNAKPELVKAKLADGSERYEVIDVTQHDNPGPGPRPKERRLKLPVYDMNPNKGK